MINQDIFQEILAKKYISVSWGDTREIPKVDYPHFERFELFSSDAWKIVDNILASLPKDAHKKVKRLCHVTGESAHIDPLITF